MQLEVLRTRYVRSASGSKQIIDQVREQLSDGSSMTYWKIRGHSYGSIDFQVCKHIAINQ